MQKEKDCAKASGMPIPAAKAEEPTGITVIWGTSTTKANRYQIYLSFSPSKEPKAGPLQSHSLGCQARWRSFYLVSFILTKVSTTCGTALPVPQKQRVRYSKQHAVTTFLG